MDTQTLVNTAVAALEEIKGKDITVLDVHHLTSLFDTMIIACGDSSRQVKALADNVQVRLKETGAEIIGVEGERTGEWVLVDTGSLVVHVMHPAVRHYYNLEELWGGTLPPPSAERRSTPTGEGRSGGVRPLPQPVASV